MNRHALQQIPFFVYGTLIPGQPNDHLWRGGIKSIETAVFRNGKLYDLGHYPMLVEEGVGTVRGKLISVANGQYKDILQRLDSLEGYNPEQPSKSSFRRIKREVTTGTGQKFLCWLYVGRQEFVLDGKMIPSGDWENYAAETYHDMDLWWTNVDTVLGFLDGADNDGA